MSDSAVIEREERPAGQTSGMATVGEPPAAHIQPPEGARLTLLGVLGVGFSAFCDWLFWGHPRGWTVGAFGFLLLLALLAWERAFPHRRVVALLVPAIVLLSLQCVEDPNSLTIAIGLLALFTLALVLRVGWIGSAAVWVRRWTLLVVRGWHTLFRDVGAWRRQRQLVTGPPRSAFYVLGMWIVPIVLGAMFLALFAKANPVLAKWLADVWRGLRDLLQNIGEHIPPAGRVLMWVVVVLGVWALLRFRPGVETNSRSDEADVEAMWRGLPASLVVRCLVVFNLLFLFQTGLDVYYLLAGGHLPEGLTHGEYARRGAYPLLAATILAALFVLAAFRAGPRESSMRWARRLVYVWLVQNLFLVVAAAWRLQLYVDAYTLTRWRVAAAIWMLLVFCGIVWILLRIIADRSNRWLINVNAITTAIVLYASCFANFDGWIARYNVAHCFEVHGNGPRIDLAYLESLGPDALPGLRALAVAIPDSPKMPKIEESIARLETSLRADLSSWRGWTWRRERLLQFDTSTGLRRAG